MKLRSAITIVALLAAGFLFATKYQELSRLKKEKSLLEDLLKVIPNSEISKFVSLDNPDEMLEVKESDPDLYKNVQAILEQSHGLSSEQFSTWVRVNYGAELGHMSLILRTSLPPQRYISFVLNEVRFSGLVRVHESQEYVRQRF